MTQTTDLGPSRRLKKRRAAERRLRAYGMAALSLAALALVALMWSVVSKAGNALSESYITLPVVLDASALDPDNTGDYKTILRADFAGLTKKSLRRAFPAVKKRKQKKALYNLVSSGAGFELAEKVARDPRLLGQTIQFRFLASDTADLYLKGGYGTLDQVPLDGALSVEKRGKSYEITGSGAPFRPLMAAVHERMRADAARLVALAARQEAGRLEFSRRAAQAGTAAERETLGAEATARAAKRDALNAKAQALLAAAKDVDKAVKLTGKTISVLLHGNGGWIKLTSISPTGGRGKAITAPHGQAGAWQIFALKTPESARRFSDAQVVWMETLRADKRVERVFNRRFFSASDSREPELAGIRGALVGTLLTMLVTFVLAFPLGVFAAIYLEEFAPKNRLTTFIEVNINNLAAVPSIVFGLLGLAVFIGFFGVPRSAPLAGGIVLALMTIPTIIIAARAAVRAVPPSIRDAALGVGASKIQATFHHVLPLAMPGILTGAILGMAQALGETAPLIMIGMVAFIVDVPGGILDSATVLPVQVFRWSDFPERAFEARTAAAILVLLAFLVAMNALAVFLRKRVERRW